MSSLPLINLICSENISNNPDNNNEEIATLIRYKYNRENMQRTSRAYLIIICIAILLTAGCTGAGSPSTNIVPTQQVVRITEPVTPIPTDTPSQDPIIGVWRFGIEDFDYRYQYEVNPNGTSRFSSFFSGKKVISFTGTWYSEGHNVYILPNPESKRDEWVWIYVPSSDTLHNQYSPLIEYHRYMGNPNIAPSGNHADGSDELLNISKVIS